MINVYITVSGPGGCINSIVEAVQKVLTDYNTGQLQVINDHPYIGDSNTDLDLKDFEIKLIAKHNPWGG